MVKINSTKRALLVNIVSMLICISMLIGGTFAWFTDSAGTGINRIAAGNLDVTLKYGTPNMDMTLFEGDWQDATGVDSLFTSNLWEPGHVEVVYLEIGNNGTLAFKYHFMMNYTETGSKNIYGEDFLLSDYLKYAVVELGDTIPAAPYGNRAEAIAAAGTGMDLAAFFEESKTMLSGDKRYVAVVVWMPDSVGNEANYMTGEAIPTIDLGINLTAAQIVHEGDDFDNQYDFGAMYDESTMPTTIISNGMEISYYGTTIVSGAGFAGTTLTASDIPGSVVTIGRNSFQDFNLTSVTLPSAITYIGVTAFAENASLVTVDLSETGITELSGYTFYNDTALTSVILPDTVTSIGRQDFYKCTSLTTIVLPDGLTVIGNRAFQQSGLSGNIIIPESVTIIDENAFYEATGITGINIPSGVTIINDNAFRNLAITDITIPAGVTSIGNYAFRDCKSLSTINFNGTVAQWNDISFGSGWKLNVPATTVICSDGTATL